MPNEFSTSLALDKNSRKRVCFTSLGLGKEQHNSRNRADRSLRTLVVFAENFVQTPTQLAETVVETHVVFAEKLAETFVETHVVFAKNWQKTLRERLNSKFQHVLARHSPVFHTVFRKFSRKHDINFHKCFHKILGKHDICVSTNASASFFRKRDMCFHK